MDVIKQMYDIPAWCPASGNEYRRAARAAAHVGSCPCEQDRRGSCTGAAGGGLRWAPPLVFGLYAGVLSDRLDRRRIVIAADGIRAVVLSVLIATMIAGRVSVTVALLALGLLATAEVFADNTTATLTPMLVRRDDLAVANSRLQTGFITLNQLAGPPIGATRTHAGPYHPDLQHHLRRRLVGPGALRAPAARPRRRRVRPAHHGFGSRRPARHRALRMDHPAGEPGQRDARRADHRDPHPPRTRRHHFTVDRLADLLHLRRPRIRLGNDLHHRPATGGPGTPAGPGQQRQHHQRVRRPGRRLRHRRHAGRPLRRHRTVLVRLRRLGDLRGASLARADPDRPRRRAAAHAGALPAIPEV